MEYQLKYQCIGCFKEFHIQCGGGDLTCHFYISDKNTHKDVLWCSVDAMKVTLS